MKLLKIKITLIILILILICIGLFINPELQFKYYYWRLEKYRAQSSVKFSSSTTVHNDCGAFRKIVKGGEKNIPFIMEKIIEGDFFLHQAMDEITCIDIRKRYPNDIIRGEQGESKLWVKWWTGDTAFIRDSTFYNLCRDLKENKTLGGLRESMKKYGWLKKEKFKLETTYAGPQPPFLLDTLPGLLFSIVPEMPINDSSIIFIKIGINEEKKKTTTELTEDILYKYIWKDLENTKLDSLPIVSVNCWDKCNPKSVTK